MTSFAPSAAPDAGLPREFAAPSVLAANEGGHDAEERVVCDRDDRADRLRHAPGGKTLQRRRHRRDEVVHRQDSLDVGFGQEAETDGHGKLLAAHGFADCVDVYGDDRVDVPRVAAAHRDGDGQPAIAAGLEHHAIAGAQAVDGELQTPEPIAFVRVGAAEVEHQVGPMRVEDARQVAGERGEILIVSGPVLEGDVEVALLLPERKVVGAVQREREHRGLVPKDGGGAVPLVHVAVDDRRASDGALAQEDGRRDRDVVEHAVAFAAIAEGVMGAAGEVGGNARLTACAIAAP